MPPPRSTLLGCAPFCGAHGGQLPLQSCPPRRTIPATAVRAGRFPGSDHDESDHNSEDRLQGCQGHYPRPVSDVPFSCLDTTQDLSPEIGGKEPVGLTSRVPKQHPRFMCIYLMATSPQRPLAPLPWPSAGDERGNPPRTVQSPRGGPHILMSISRSMNIREDRWGPATCSATALHVRDLAHEVQMPLM